jgi:hypothetical protein
LRQFRSETDARGSLTVIEESDAPFAFKRVYFIYDVPAGKSRGGHAHRKSQLMLVPAAGSFDVHVDDGFRKGSHRLDRRSTALVIPDHIWLHLDNFSPGAVCLALSSHLFAEDDYLADYDEFRRAVGAAP